MKFVIPNFLLTISHQRYALLSGHPPSAIRGGLFSPAIGDRL